MRELRIIGGGMGNPLLLTEEAKCLLQECGEVYAFDRMAKLLGCLHPNIKKCAYQELTTLLLQSEAEKIGVLVSGDSGFFSVSALLERNVGDRFRIVRTCGINSLQYLASKLNFNYEAVNIVSLHGRSGSLLGSIAYHRDTFVLAGSDHRPADILRELVDCGLGGIKVCVGEFLSMEEERILTGTVKQLSAEEFDPLSVLLFQNEHPAAAAQPLFDRELQRDKVPMTKQEVRWTSVNELELMPEDIVYDIGAGTGSVSVEMARKVCSGIVYAIEKEEDAYLLLNKNKERFGAFNIITRFGNAIDHLRELPVPDKAFIGGSGQELEEILAYLFEVNPGIKIVINAITLETLSSAMALFTKHNCEVQVTCMNISRNKIAGAYNLMMANNPVYILAGKKKQG